ncbi:hypothetical protein HK101_004088, partial [Irineochytrium annulatum]
MPRPSPFSSPRKNSPSLTVKSLVLLSAISLLVGAAEAAPATTSTTAPVFLPKATTTSVKAKTTAKTTPKTTVKSTAAPTATSAAKFSWTYSGCYDMAPYISSFTLGNSGVPMSVETCSSFCPGSLWIAFLDTYCYCGGSNVDYPKLDQQNDLSAKCINYPCKAPYQNQPCGIDDSVNQIYDYSVWTKTSYVPSKLPAVSPVITQPGAASYSETGTFDLATLNATGDFVTTAFFRPEDRSVEKCSAACGPSANFIAIQGGLCACGTNPAPALARRAANINFSGATSQAALADRCPYFLAELCGSVQFGLFSVYQNSAPVIPTPVTAQAPSGPTILTFAPGSTPLPAISETVGSWTYEGCFTMTNFIQGFTFTGYFPNPLISLQACAALCPKSGTIALIENYCYCGDQYTIPNLVSSQKDYSSNCYRCPYFRSEMCGYFNPFGTSYYSVYQNIAAGNPPPPPVVATIPGQVVGFQTFGNCTGVRNGDIVCRSSSTFNFCMSNALVYAADQNCAPGTVCCASTNKCDFSYNCPAWNASPAVANNTCAGIPDNHIVCTSLTSFNICQKQTLFPWPNQSCPAGLVCCQGLNRCDYAANCPYSPFYLPPTASTPSVSGGPLSFTANTCVGVTDGRIACKSTLTFGYCMNGAFVYGGDQSCPLGTVCCSKTNMCDFAYNCPQNGSPPATLTQTPTIGSATPSTSPVTVTLGNCNGKANGFLVCTSTTQFNYCFNNAQLTAPPQSCAPGTVCCAATNRCDYANNCPAANVIITAGNPGTANPTAVPTTVPAAGRTFPAGYGNCSAIPSGNIVCTSGYTFNFCNNGVMYNSPDQTCAPYTVCCPTSNQCTFASWCKSAIPIVNATIVGQVASPPPAMTPAPGPSGATCKGITDGNIVCVDSTSFNICSAGAFASAKTQACPTGTVCCAATNTCDYALNCPSAVFNPAPANFTIPGVPNPIVVPTGPTPAATQGATSAP